MFHAFVLLCLSTVLRLCCSGVFGVDPDEVKSVSVLEGHYVTLHTNVTDIQRIRLLLWKFGPTEALIVKINKEANKTSVYADVQDGMFRDRLQVDDQTGSLTITNNRIAHSGLYQITISSWQKTTCRFNVTVYARLPIPIITNSSSSERSSVSKCALLCSVVKTSHVSVSWYKGKSLLSSISVSEHRDIINISLHLECLNDSYTCVLNNPITNQTQHLTSDDCQPCSGTTARAAVEDEVVYAEVTIIKR
ncbi:SLAM family member 9-like [Triplophysa rosa]|uniref:SLAM family member 9-like n=1 Tax=Triplophysa rosa TaxID=992332 RepID=UPI002546130B|nr:SLAM family member 9-like [Triplophysa rosa]